jgi:hypothetical protein
MRDTVKRQNVDNIHPSDNHGLLLGQLVRNYSVSKDLRALGWQGTTLKIEKTTFMAF